MNTFTLLSRFARNTAVILAGSAMLASTTPASAASTTFGAVLRNNTSMTITYLARLNKGAWKLQSLAPGASRYYAYQQPKTIPEIDVAYDNTLGDGRTTYSVMRLKMWWCGEPKYGWLQTFIVVNSEKNLFISG